MKMKNNEGISLIALVVTIIVLVIITTIVIFPGIMGINITQKARIATEKKDISTVAVKRFGQYTRNENLYPLLGDNITQTEAITKIYKEKLKQDINASREEVVDMVERDIKYIRIVNNVHAKELGVEEVSEGNIYIVNYYTGDVFGPINSEM